MEEITLLQGDCLELLKDLPDGSVDMVLCDLPYGTTACKWDSVIPFEPLWEQYKWITKQSSAIVLFADEPFESSLIMSNKKMFRHKWVWDKGRGSNFQNAKFSPMKCTEDIAVFYSKKPIYNPQFWFSKLYRTTERPRKNQINGLGGGSVSNYCTATISDDGKRYPLNLLQFKRDGDRVHPTQKPVALLEYLIRTYTNPGMTVLDNCMGSGSTGVACVNTGRKFIGMELDPGYFEMAKQRIEKAVRERESA